MVDSDATSDLAKVILRYFLQNPEAADTLEGIAHWRLLETRVRESLVEVADSLDLLISLGYLSRVSQMGSNPIFRLNRDMAGDIGRFLAQTTITGNSASEPER
ncbi:hypothetical protein ACFLQW_02625 [Candidatus Zixiibacteriota bacterium]